MMVYCLRRNSATWGVVVRDFWKWGRSQTRSLHTIYEEPVYFDHDVAAVFFPLDEARKLV
jgi:hypothetical protein